MVPLEFAPHVLDQIGQYLHLVQGTLELISREAEQHPNITLVRIDIHPARSYESFDIIVNAEVVIGEFGGLDSRFAFWDAISDRLVEYEDSLVEAEATFLVKKIYISVSVA